MPYLKISFRVTFGEGGDEWVRVVQVPLDYHLVLFKHNPELDIPVKGNTHKVHYREVVETAIPLADPDPKGAPMCLPPCMSLALRQLQKQHGEQ